MGQWTFVLFLSLHHDTPCGRRAHGYRIPFLPPVPLRLPTAAHFSQERVQWSDTGTPPSDVRIDSRYPTAGHVPRTLGTHLGPGFMHVLRRSVRAASPLRRHPRSVPFCPMICDRRFCLFPRICPCQTYAIAFRVRICAGCFGPSLGP
ncbi:hypothetical protein K466DRAFT_316394 [Polyporus arcularius HHB13444]|uniref:Uncharacterized protein n=1 Tax=Polyporus arcularius HHB13444 TaxID=1314778 RepID=A0A5C3PQQ0_9APHY|nr:hypothetical protein K466DRAFT_316394 [Polyporus arcularius HHB13444]